MERSPEIAPHACKRGRKGANYFKAFSPVVSNDLQLCSHMSGAGKLRDEQVGVQPCCIFPFSICFRKDGGLGGEVGRTRARSWTYATGIALI